mgnify:CR=1 FL=1
MVDYLGDNAAPPIGIGYLGDNDPGWVGSRHPGDADHRTKAVRRPYSVVEDDHLVEGDWGVVQSIVQVKRLYD